MSASISMERRRDPFLGPGSAEASERYRSCPVSFNQHIEPTPAKPQYATGRRHIGRGQSPGRGQRPDNRFPRNRNFPATIVDIELVSLTLHDATLVLARIQQSGLRFQRAWPNPLN
jgi:hypothetical protein